MTASIVFESCDIDSQRPTHPVEETEALTDLSSVAGDFTSNLDSINGGLQG